MHPKRKSWLRLGSYLLTYLICKGTFLVFPFSLSVPNLLLLYSIKVYFKLNKSVSYDSLTMKVVNFSEHKNGFEI